MSFEFLYGINEWLLFAIIALLLYAGAEIGFRYGLRFSHRTSPEVHSHVATIEGALLGLLALLLGFAFSMAMTRFETRKQVVLEEVNDLSTTYLRAHLLTGNYRQQSLELLEQYIDSRLNYLQAGADQERIKAAQEKTRLLQIELWAIAVQASQDNSDEVRTGYYVESLNRLIDDHTKRSNAMENHVPEIILILLIMVAVLTLSITGYSSGLRTKRLRALRCILVVLIAATFTVIIDLDRPRRGLIRVNESEMLRLKTELPDFKARLARPR